MQLKDILKDKCGGNFIKLVLLFHDNAPAHRSLATQKKLSYLGFHCLDHPPYSPDLVPSDYLHFSELKKKKDLYFSSDVEVIAAAENWLDGQYCQFL